MGTDPSAARPERIDTPADGALRAYVAAANAGAAVAARMGAARLRLAGRAATKAAPAGPQMAAVEDHDLGNHVTARVYRPRIELLPVVVYAHGGGYVLGDLDSHDRLARRIARHGDVTVVAIDYHRAPEYPAPAAVDDLVMAVGWARSMLGLLGGRDHLGVGLAGDSAGGLLAAAAAIRLRDGAEAAPALVQPAEPAEPEGSGGGLAQAGPGATIGSSPGAAAHLLLLTPQTDLTLTQPSVTEKGRGWGLEHADLQWYVEQWAPQRESRLEPDVSPAFATLTGLPPTFLVTAEHDPLRDDGLSFADRLRGAGGVVEHLHYANLVHGFLQLAHVSPACAEAGDEALRRYGAFLRRVLPGSPAESATGA